MLQRVERRQVRPHTILEASSFLCEGPALVVQERVRRGHRRCVTPLHALDAVLLRALRRFSRRPFQPQLPLQELDAVHALLDLPDQILKQLRELVVARRQERDARS